MNDNGGRAAAVYWLVIARSAKRAEAISVRRVAEIASLHSQ